MAILDGPDRKKLRDLLLPVFSVKQFDMLLSDALNLDRETITTAPGKEAIVFDVLTELNQDHRLPELVEAARKVRPRNPALYEFSRTYFGLGIVVSEEALQRMVVKTSAFLDVVALRESLATVERRIARISYPTAAGMMYGTCFLVGPSTVITNYHVIAPIKAKQATPADVKVQFDYKRLPDGKVDEGRFVALAGGEKWLIDDSPYAQADVTVSPATLPTLDELDYAVLRLAEPVGHEPVGKTSDPDAPVRGFIDLGKAAAASPAPGTSVFIVQHPKAEPLSLAMETQGMLDANGNQTRLRYQTNTEGGSSGSPVFDQHWTLIALHHGGDPDFSKFHHPQYNQGIPIHLIVQRLQAQQKYAELSS